MGQIINRLSGKWVMHPVQEKKINTVGIYCSVQCQRKISYRKEGTVFQPRVNLDNINRLQHAKYPDRENRGIYRRITTGRNEQVD